MAVTVKKLAMISGVSVRTLHFYDEIGLLSPAYVGRNGYRYYEEEQMLMLQQILFFRELGMPLKQIHSIVTDAHFDKVSALTTHKEALVKKFHHLEKLLLTVDKTIQRLQGVITMSDKELYQGFSSEQQAEYEEYLINRYGEQAKKHLDEAKGKQLSASQIKVLSTDWEAICHDLKKSLDALISPSAPEVQDIIKRHFAMLMHFWTPNKESYVAMTKGYADLAWKKAFAPFDNHHPQLALYLAAAAEIFAEQHLN